MSAQVDNALIQKKILHPGKAYIPLCPGTRVRFHFQTRKSDGTLLDDSRKLAKPMELVLGKKFKLEVWEVIVQKMALNEVARFNVDKSLVTQYPFISKTLRDIGKKPEERRHFCGMSLRNEGIGYKDLDDLFANPTDLEFTIELLSIELPGEYEKERWEMSDVEKLASSKELREKGNQYYKAKDYAKAEDCYCRAIGSLEQLMLKEKPHDEEWYELAAMKVPLLLNYAQCRLLANDYYAVIEHCTEVLTLEPDNVKAIYRRGKAHAGAWNPIEAKKDFQRCVELDHTLKDSVAKEFKALHAEQQKRNAQDKMLMQNLF